MAFSHMKVARSGLVNGLKLKLMGEVVSDARWKRAMRAGVAPLKEAKEVDKVLVVYL